MDDRMVKKSKRGESEREDKAAGRHEEERQTER